VRRLSFLLTAALLAAQQPLSPDEIEREQLRQILSIRRVYVDRLGGGASADQIRDMVIAALQRQRLFLLTEDESRADAYLRGSAEDLIFTDVRSTREGLQVRATGSASRRQAGESEAASAGVAVGETDDRYTRERRHEAVASLRLVARNGDVLWSSTQESLGAKYKGSSLDVAEKIAKDLKEAFDRARRLPGR
jgi:hypothetical protein